MFYEEKIIDGVLHYRNDPKGEWVAHSAQSLTMQIIDLRDSGRLIRERLEGYGAHMQDLKSEVADLRACLGKYKEQAERAKQILSEGC